MSGFLLIAPKWGHVYGAYSGLSHRLNFHPPLGLCYLAAALRAAGHRALVVDAEAEGFSLDTIAREAPAYDAVGITATTPIFPAAVELAAAIKKNFRGPVVLGGPHATIVGDEALDPGCFDLLLRGEGERSITALADALARGADPAGVPGVVLRRDGRILAAPDVEREPDLDRIPFPDRSSLTPRNYLWSVPRRGLIPTTSLLYSRGCPFECTFCSQDRMYGRTVRHRSPENMAAEIAALLADTPYRHFVFLDDTFTVSRDRVLALCDAVEALGLRFTFECETRPGLLDADLVRAMRRAGLVRANIGIESADPEILRSLKTGVTTDQVRVALRLLKSQGVETRGTVIIGVPHERRETALRTLRFVAALRDLDQPYVNIAAPYPGTALRDMALRGEGGARLVRSDYAGLIRYGAAAIEVNDLSAPDLVRLQSWGLRRAYLRPRRLWYNVTRAGLRAGLSNGFAFLRGISGRLPASVPGPASSPLPENPSAPGGPQ